jgi:hypothetical protein
MKLELKEDFNIIEEGTHYELPVYKIVDDKGLHRIEGLCQKINFVRGSKLKDEEVPKRDGTLHEHLLSMMIHDLKYKNSLVPSREGSIVITKLQEALQWLRERQIERTKRNVVSTYQK